METLKKLDVVEELMKRYPDLTKEGAGIVLDTVLLQMVEALRNGRGIAFRGLGTFTVLETKSRPVNNVYTGEAMIMPAGKRIKFKPSKFILS